MNFHPVLASCQLEFYNPRYWHFYNTS